MTPCTDCSWLLLNRSPVRGDGKCKPCAGTGNKDRWARKLFQADPEVRSDFSCSACNGRGICQACLGRGVK